MRHGSQSEVIEFLKASGAQAKDDTRVIETHISVIVLQGRRAWKLKRAVCLPYADFSTPASRLAACEREVELNRRTAPSIYLGTRRITRDDNGVLAFDGSGELIDAVVEMTRFDDNTLFSKLAEAGKLDRALLTELAQNIATFHEQAEIRPGGGAANIEAILTLNEQATHMGRVLGETPVRQLRASLRAGLARHAKQLDARAEAGRVRLCHGDLHLRNLCLVDGRPTLFDCIEFNDTLASIDTLYDLAFLLMDLWQAGLQAEANWVMNRYLDASGDPSGLPLLSYFMALRASIRAQVLATQAEPPSASDRESLISQARIYLTLAMQLLEPQPARLLAIGGLSGSGKSTVAAAIAHRIGMAPGARILASDRLRKSLAGVTAETRLPADSYTLESSQHVYAVLYEQAARTLADGHSVIADAVFSRLEERQAIEACATQAGLPFQGVWLEADPAVLLARVAARRNDPSDATANVVSSQLEYDLGPLAWTIVPGSDTADDIIQLLGLSTTRPMNTPLTETPPPWSDAPEGWNWLAQDADGCWYWYAVQPQLGLPGGIWRSPRRAQQLAAQGLPNPLWYESLLNRPSED